MSEGICWQCGERAEVNHSGVCAACWEKYAPLRRSKIYRKEGT